MRRTLTDLSADYVRSILSLDDPMTGELRWRVRSDVPKEWNTRRAGRIAGAPSGGRGEWQIRINDRLYLRHRLVYLIVYGKWPPADIDHARSRSDGIDNIRAATTSQNLFNKGAQKNNTSGFKGVNFDRQTGRWRAKIKSYGRHYHLGRFDTPYEAAAAYREAAARLHGEFARS